MIPRSANGAAVVVQVLLMLTVFAVVLRLRANLDGAIAAPALMPAVFLLTNRVFSPRFALVALAAWAVAIALLARSRVEQLPWAPVAMLATYANAIVFPGFAGSWVGWSALYFHALGRPHGVASPSRRPPYASGATEVVQPASQDAAAAT